MSPTLLQNFVSLASAAGGGLLALTAGVSHRQLCALISFAAGALFATTFLHIVPEAFGEISWMAIVAALVSGYLLFYLISRFVFHVCPACAASHFDEQTTAAFKKVATLLFIALGIHCTMDGLALAFGGELEARSDRSIFLTLTVHKFPEGLALTALLMRAKVEKWRALFSMMAIECLTVAGWVFGMAALESFEINRWLYFGLVHIGGGFIYLAFHAVLNESREHASRYVVFFFLVGIAFVALTGLIPAR